MKKITSFILMLSMTIPMSLIPLATSASTTLFSDGFEVGTAFSAWDSSGSKWSVGGSEFHSGAKSASVAGSTGSSDDYIVRSVSTVGYQNISLDYWYKSVSLSGSDYVKAEWSSNGSTWNTLFTISSNASSWTHKTHALPVGVKNISGFKIRFSAHLSSGSHKVYLDDISVIGDAIPVDQAPTISVTPNTQTVEATGPSGAVAAYTVSAIDNEDGNISGSAVCDVVSGSIFTLGNTTVNCSITDSASHTVNTSATVTVVDTTGPVITLNGSNTVAMFVGDVYSESGATATDLVDGTVAVVVGGATVDTNTPGTYVVTYNAIDSHGNAATEVARTVVVSAIPVVMVTLPDVTVEATSPAGAVVDYGTIILPDNDETIVGTCTPATGGTFALGSTQVTCTGMDVSEDENEQIIGTFNAIVVDTTAPVIAFVGNSVVNLTVGDLYTDQGATATDLVDGDLTSQIVSVNPVDANTAGTYTVTYNVVDSHENHAVEVTRTVVVAPVVVDVCSNIDGSQATVPEGMSVNDGVCAANTVIPPAPTTDSNTGGNGPIVVANGPISGSMGGGQVLGAFASSGQVLGESCGLYLNQHLRMGSSKNSSEQVRKLQEFLNKHLGLNIQVTGYFGKSTEDAVKSFQVKYSSEILDPWKLNSPTGLVYLSTVRKINNIECPDIAPSLPELVPWSLNPNAQ